MNRALRSLLVLRGWAHCPASELIQGSNLTSTALAATSTCIHCSNIRTSCSSSYSTSSAARQEIPRADQRPNRRDTAATGARKQPNDAVQLQQQRPQRGRPDGGNIVSRGGGQGQGGGHLSDLALENAPTKILQLIGDPRSGVADDVTDNPFGTTTCDMVHHQQSNEVYWYKYEFAADQLPHAHRDGRLSEAAKNLMYLLRAKDPNRWTIEALAHKFRIRQQRVLAILALKDMESASMESGRSMRGVLSGYACTVHMDDILLDPQGGVVPEGGAAAQQAMAHHVSAAAAAANQHSDVLRSIRRAVQAVHVDSGVLPLHNAIPRSKLVAQQVQAQLAQLLGSYQYDLSAARQQLLGRLDATVAATQAAMPAEAVAAAGESTANDQEGAAATAGSVAAATVVVERLTALRQAMAALFDCLEQLLLESPAAPASDEAVPAAAPAGQGWQSPVLEQARQVATASQVLEQLLSSAPAAATAAAAAADSELAGKLQAAVAGLRGGALLRAVVALKPPLRVRFLDHMPHMAVEMNAAGVDLPALKVQDKFAPSQSSAAAGTTPTGSNPAAPLDVLGWMYIAPEQYKKLIKALAQVTEAQAAVAEAQSQLAPGLPAMAQPVAVTDVLDGLQRQSEQYRGALMAVQQVYSKTAFSEGGSLRETLKLMHAADPGVLNRLTTVEAIRQLEAAGDTATAAQLRTQLREAAGQLPAPATSDVPDSGIVVDRVGSPALGAQGGDASWDAVAAWLEAVPGKKRFNRGSGERQVARVPSFPAFEGQPLPTLDKTDESQLSFLNRELSKRQEQVLVRRFQSDLVFNLGLRGDKVWDGSTPRSDPNLESRLDSAPMVVYDIGADGQTRLPPLFVVNKDGTRRPLNEQERVWQERRQRDLIPHEQKVHYTMTRIKRKPELM